MIGIPGLEAIRLLFKKLLGSSRILFLPLLSVALLLLLVLVRFPYSRTELAAIEEQGTFSTPAQTLFLTDSVHTASETSFYYLWKTADGELYLSTATRFPF